MPPAQQLKQPAMLVRCSLLVAGAVTTSRSALIVESLTHTPK